MYVPLRLAWGASHPGADPSHASPGRFLYRSATFLGGIVGELKPSGRAGAALRGASNRALGLVGSAPPAQLGDS